MKTRLSIAEMIPYLPSEMKDAIHSTAKSAGLETDKLELHRQAHSEKSKVNQIDPSKRQSLSYISVRTQDRDDEIVIPEALDLTSFARYKSVLVNHNYSLLPIGSDEETACDSWGIRALTNHADTGPGTLANVVWDLVSQGHLNAKSVGFVPTSFTKPGDRNWDSCANKLQAEWKEFNKAKAEKSVSRIITGGVLLEHSFVSVPCNADATLIGIVKSMNLEEKITKQLGWELDKASGLLVTKGMENDTATEDKGALLPPIECVFHLTSNKKMSLSHQQLQQELQKLLPKPVTQGDNLPLCPYVVEVFDDYVIYCDGGTYFQQDYSVEGKDKVTLDGQAEEVVPRLSYDLVSEKGGPGSGSWNGPGDPRGDQEVGKVEGKEEYLPENRGYNFRGTPGKGTNTVRLSFDDEQRGEAHFDSHYIMANGTKTSMDIYGPATHNSYGEFNPKVASDLSPGTSLRLEHGKITPRGDSNLGSARVQITSAKLSKDNYDNQFVHVEFRQLGSNAKKSTDETDPEVVIKASTKIQPCTCDECGAEAECAPGEMCMEGDCEGTMEPVNSQRSGKSQKAQAGDDQNNTTKDPIQDCVCDECGAKAECTPGLPCTVKDCKGTMEPAKSEKEVTTEEVVVKVLREPTVVKVIKVPIDQEVVVKQVSEAVERVVSRKMGRIL